MRVSPILLSMALVLLLAVPLPSTSAGSDPIQPGGRMHTSTHGCTLNFVFDGTGSLNGRVFIGTAAHCVDSVGERIGLVGHANVGTVFYLGDVPNSINGDGRGDNGYPGHQLDFALIEITGVNHPVSAEVKGHPGWPTGATVSTETRSWDETFLSGYGMVFSTTQQTREMRSGVLYMDNARFYNTYAPAAPGDSGGPVLHESGKALGIASTIGPNGLAGPTVEGVTTELADLGIPIQLRTA